MQQGDMKAKLQLRSIKNQILFLTKHSTRKSNCVLQEEKTKIQRLQKISMQEKNKLPKG